jgi:hypothetical protein
VQHAVVEGEVLARCRCPGPMGFRSKDWKRGRWEDTGKGKCTSNTKEAPMARRGLAEMQGRRRRKGGRRMGSMVPSVC